MVQGSKNKKWVPLLAPGSLNEVRVRADWWVNQGLSAHLVVVLWLQGSWKSPCTLCSQQLRNGSWFPGSFGILLFIIAPTAPVQLFSVPFGFFIFCCSRKYLSRCKHSASRSQADLSCLTGGEAEGRLEWGPLSWSSVRSTCGTSSMGDPLATPYCEEATQEDLCQRDTNTVLRLRLELQVRPPRRVCLCVCNALCLIHSSALETFLLWDSVVFQAHTLKFWSLKPWNRKAPIGQ